MSYADQQPLQNASITLDWRVIGLGNRRPFKAQPRTKHNPSKHNLGPSTNQPRTKHNQGDACKISPVHNLRSPRKKSTRDYTVLQGFCANLLSNAAQQASQSASIALDWQAAAQSKSWNVSRSADLTRAKTNASGLAVRCFSPSPLAPSPPRRLTPLSRPVTR